MEWISVKDKLPSNDKQVEVVFYKSPYEWFTGMYTPIGFCGEKSNTFSWHNHQVDDNYIVIESVTHWLPLPNPPKE